MSMLIISSSYQNLIILGTYTIVEILIVYTIVIILGSYKNSIGFIWKALKTIFILKYYER
jgi:hypothetical protein